MTTDEAINILTDGEGALDKAASAARLAMVGNPDADELTCSICAAAIRAMKEQP
jgi:hypothetical protein